VRKFEELYDMSDKQYNDSVWKEKLWGQIGEELKKIRQGPAAHIEVIIILLSQKF
jgi:hypothetical protein